MKASMKDCFLKYIESDKLILATFFDPRYKDHLLGKDENSLMDMVSTAYNDCTTLHEEGATSATSSECETEEPSAIEETATEDISS